MQGVSVSEELKIANVKGNVYLIQRNYIRTKWGEEILKRIENELSEKWGNYLRNPESLGMQFVPQTFFSDFYKCVVNTVNLDSEKLCKELGNIVIKNVVNKVMIAMFKMGTPNILAVTSATLWSRNYDQGKAEVETGKNQFVFIVKNYRPASRFNGLSLWGGLEAYVEMIGYQVVSSNYDKSVLNGDDYEQYTVKWK